MISYIPNTKEDQKEMLKELGAKSIEELFDSIPQSLWLKAEMDIPSSLSEMELVKELRKLSEKNANLDEYISFL